MLGMPEIAFAVHYALKRFPRSRHYSNTSLLVGHFPSKSKYQSI
jgi:hypothetical protein